jgi:hypothetical protein
MNGSSLNVSGYPAARTACVKPAFEAGSLPLPAASAESRNVLFHAEFLIKEQKLVKASLPGLQKNRHIAGSGRSVFPILSDRLPEALPDCEHTLSPKSRPWGDPASDRQPGGRHDPAP